MTTITTTTKEQQARYNGHRLKLAVARIQLRTDKHDLARELLKSHGYTWEKEGAQWVLYTVDHTVVGVGQEAVVTALEMMEATETCYTQKKGELYEHGENVPRPDPRRLAGNMAL